MKGIKKSVRIISLAAVIVLLGSHGLYSQPSRDQSFRSRAPQRVVDGEVIDVKDLSVTVLTDEGLTRVYTTTSRTTVIREDTVDKGLIAIGKKLYIFGEIDDRDVIHADSIRILDPLLLALQGGRVRRAPGPRRAQSRRQSATESYVVEVVKVKPLRVKLENGETKSVTLSDRTTIIKESLIKVRDVGIGAKVKVIASTRTVGSGELMKLIVFPADGPSGRSAAPPPPPIAASSTRGSSTLLPDITQRPLVEDEFIFGVWLGRGRYTNIELDRAFKVASNLAVRYLVVEFKWEYVEPQNNQWRWNDERFIDVDHVIKLARDYDLSIIPYFDFFMPWGERVMLDPRSGQCIGPPNRRGRSSTPDPNEYAEYVFNVVDRLIRGGVDLRYVELDNEVSNINDGYKPMNCFIDVTARSLKVVQNTAYDRIKKSHPDVLVSSTSFSFPGIGSGPKASGGSGSRGRGGSGSRGRRGSGVSDRGGSGSKARPGSDESNKTRNSFIKAYFEDAPAPRFDFLALHETLSGSGGPYTTLVEGRSSSSGYNFSSYHDAYDIWREILDKYGYKETPIFNLESAAVKRGLQGAQLLQRAIFARANAGKNNVIGWVVSQLTGSIKFTEGGGRGRTIVGITKLGSGFELRDGYTAYHTLMTTLAKYPVYDGMVMGRLNSDKPWVEKFSDAAGNVLYAAFIPYSHSRGGGKEASIKVGADREVKVTSADAPTTTIRSNQAGYVTVKVGATPIFLETVR